MPRQIRCAAHAHRSRVPADGERRGAGDAGGAVPHRALPLLRALPTFRENGLSFFTSTGWNPAVPGQTGVAALLYGTLVIATIALVLAVPVSLLTALCLTEYVSPRDARARW